ncbi:MAG: sugar phosphate isomerase/epimerase [Fimbriimonadales bacterium]|nr:sugar phosphate isomerase/epimerase [Fimbriimonadales bacterium]
MRFGLCCGPDRAPDALRAGFDYSELPAAPLAELRPEELKSLAREALPEATNLFFSGSVRLYGPGAADWRPIAERTIRAAAGAGVRVMVLGSGGARRAPEAWTAEQAERQFLLVAEELQRMAEPFGIRIAPEPLNADECDVWNDQGALARALAERGVGYCLDSYHLLHWWRRSEPEAERPSRRFLEEQIPHAPVHAHWANFPFRSWPKHGDPAAQAVAERLRTVGYDGRVSLECRLEWPSDAEPALLALRGLFELS